MFRYKKMTWKRRAMRGKPRRRRRAPAMSAGSRLIVMLLFVKNCFAASSAFSFTTSSCASSKRGAEKKRKNYANACLLLFRFADFLSIAYSGYTEEEKQFQTIRPLSGQVFSWVEVSHEPLFIQGLARSSYHFARAAWFPNSTVLTCNASFIVLHVFTPYPPFAWTFYMQKERPRP